MYVQEVLTLMFLRRTYTVFKSVFICKLKIGGRWESQIRGICGRRNNPFINTT